MAALVGFMLVGLVLTIRWGATPYEPWSAPAPAGERPVRAIALTYLRGVAVALVGGFWAGALVTGPAMRLIMRLLAATSGDDAQGRLTEADEIVGDIALDGTIGLYIFGGLLPGLFSGAIYVLVRKWLPAGRLGGVAFGVLHLIVAGTRSEPLRPDNPDFAFLGPGWLAVVTFGAAAIVHGMAVAALANRFSRGFPPQPSAERVWLRWLPLAPPALLLIPGAFLLIPIGIGLLAAVPWTRLAAHSRLGGDGFVRAGRILLVVIGLVLLPGALHDLSEIVRS